MVYKPFSHISHKCSIDFPQISLANGGYFNQRSHHVWVHHPVVLSVDFLHRNYQKNPWDSPIVSRALIPPSQSPAGPFRTSIHGGFFLMVYKPLSHIFHRFSIDFPQISLATGGYFNQRSHHVWVHHPIGLDAPCIGDSEAGETQGEDLPRGGTSREMIRCVFFRR